MPNQVIDHVNRCEECGANTSGHRRKRHADGRLVCPDCASKPASYRTANRHGDRRNGMVWKSCGRCNGDGGKSYWPGGLCYDCRGDRGKWVPEAQWDAEQRRWAEEVADRERKAEEARAKQEQLRNEFDRVHWPAMLRQISEASKEIAHAWDQKYHDSGLNIDGPIGTLNSIRINGGPRAGWASGTRNDLVDFAIRRMPERWTRSALEDAVRWYADEPGGGASEKQKGFLGSLLRRKGLDPALAELQWDRRAISNAIDLVKDSRMGSYRTASGMEVSRKAYLTHLAVTTAPDPDAVRKGLAERKAFVRGRMPITRADMEAVLYQDPNLQMYTEEFKAGYIAAAMAGAGDKSMNGRPYVGYDYPHDNPLADHSDFKRGYDLGLAHKKRLEEGLQGPWSSPVEQRRYWEGLPDPADTSTWDDPYGSSFEFTPPKGY